MYSLFRDIGRSGVPNLSKIRTTASPLDAALVFASHVLLADSAENLWFRVRLCMPGAYLSEAVNPKHKNYPPKP